MIPPWSFFYFSLVLLGTSFVAVRGLALGAHSPAAPISRLVRLMHCLLSEMAVHFRYLPDATVCDLALTVMQLLAQPPHGFNNNSTPHVNGQALTMSHWLGVYDSSAAWFRAWACRLPPVKMAAALHQSGLVAALIQRAHGEGVAAEAESTAPSNSETSCTTLCLDCADSATTSPLGSSSDTSLLPWPMLDDLHLKFTLSMLGTVALFHVDETVLSQPPTPSPPSLRELITVLTHHFLSGTEVAMATPREEEEEEESVSALTKRRLVASVLAEIVDTNSAAAEICCREVRK